MEATYYAIAYQPMSFNAWYSSVMTGVSVAMQLVSWSGALARYSANRYETKITHITDEEAAEKDTEIQKGESDALWPVGILCLVGFVAILQRYIVAVFLL